MSVCEVEAALKDLPEEILLSEFIAPSAAKQLLAEYGGIYLILLRTSAKQLASIKGVNKTGLKRLVCLKAVILRLEEERKKQIPGITRPQDAAAYCSDMRNLQQEEIQVLRLDTKNRILSKKRIFLGTVNFSPVSAREIFHAAVQAMAATIIVVHDHPSGDPAPRREDKEVTKVLVQAGETLNNMVLDHIIIGKNGYYSFKEAGQIINQ